MHRKRKIVLFIVEGRSEINLLQFGLSELFSSIDEHTEVCFESANGDITLDKKNIEEIICRTVLTNFFIKKKVLPEDIKEIIQIVDTDGAFINDEYVIESNRSIFYYSDRIECSNVDGIRARNARKKENLLELCRRESIVINEVHIRYSVFYFSANLDHVCHNNANLPDSLKVQKAREFAMKHRDLNDFIAYFTNNNGIKTNDYDESWNYIQRGKNSLRRKTNLNVLISSLYKKQEQQTNQRELNS